MNLKFLKDHELLNQTQQLVKNERQLLTQILQHLREVERRKLFSELGYQSLFEYTVKELKYSEGQASRRLQAMRLIKEIPNVEKKIKAGKLSLSNISQAQSYFREVKKVEPEKKLELKEKIKVLECLEEKSARDGQKILIQMQPEVALPKESERMLTESHTEVRFVMDRDLKNRLEELRSLLGVKGAQMSLSELVNYMAGVSVESLKIKKFGKKRTQGASQVRIKKIQGCENQTQVQALKDQILPQTQRSKNQVPPQVHTSRHQAPSQTQTLNPLPTSALHCSKNPRYVSKKLKHQIWVRDGGKCCQCGSQRSLNIDHIKPVALGGGAQLENLCLLCFHCNQRASMNIFGVEHVQRKIKAESYRSRGVKKSYHPITSS